MQSRKIFTLEYTSTEGAARVGTITTPHGVIHTPIFMPVGTVGTVKGVSQEILTNEIKPDIILCNNYHLYIRPGLEIIKKAGGVHPFISWKKPILTDSGGFQVYSLAHNRKIKEEGVIFASHTDGSKHLFTPENVVDMQRVIGSNIMMVLDECTPFPCEYKYAKDSMHRTHRWAKRSREQFDVTEGHYGYEQFQFGIVQGSTFEDLRIHSAKAIADMDFEGNAIGGLAVGEPENQLYDFTELVCSHLPTDKPRYLMGVGTPANMLETIARGVDMMDCVMPTRNARHAHLFYRDGYRNFRNAKYKDDFSPIDETGCEVDRMYSKAYLRHLFHCEETLALVIGSIHNLYFYMELVREARQRILDGTFYAWKKELVPKLSQRL